MNNLSTPNYKKIYTDIINEKFPSKKELCQNILNKEALTFLDIINLNKKLFNNLNKEIKQENQKYRSYNKETILQILEYQVKNRLNNTQLAIHFNLSRNTVAKWKKIYLKFV